MNFFEDLKMVYKKAFKDTTVKIKSSPIFLILPLVYGVLYTLATTLIGTVFGLNLGVIAGFIIPLVTSFILSSYFSVLSDLIYYNRISFRNFKNTFMAYFASIYSVYFILILISWIMPAFGGNTSIFILISIVINLAINPIAESIYIRG